MVKTKGFFIFMLFFLILICAERNYQQMYYQTQFNETSSYAAYRSMILEEEQGYAYFQEENFKKNFYREWERRKLIPPSSISIVYFLSETGGICESQCNGVQIGIKMQIQYWRFIYRVNYHIAMKGETK